MPRAAEYRSIGTIGGVEFVEVVQRRRMTRRFDPERPIGRDRLRMLMKLAIRAPSAGHTQGWRFLVLDDITSRDRFWSATSEGEPDAWRRGMATAPALVLCLSDREAYLDRYAEPDKGWTDRSVSHWPMPYWDVDVGMAAMILLLAAQDDGLGACFFGVPGERWSALRSAFAIDDRFSFVGVVALGHRPGDDRSRPLRRGRRPVEEVVVFAADQPSPDPG
jgi:nitroreductase